MLKDSWLFPVISLLVTALLLAGCGTSTSAPVPTFVAPTPGIQLTPGMQSPVSSVLIGRTTILVARGDLIDTVTARGEMVADPQTTLAFPTNGVVKEVHAVSGNAVTKGTVLAELDAAALERAVLQSANDLVIAKLELAHAEARAADASELEIARAKLDLAEIYSDSMLDAVIQSESNVAIARVELSQAESNNSGDWAAVELARQRLAQAEALDQALKAQLSGVGSDYPVSQHDALARKFNIAIAELEVAQAEAQIVEVQHAVDIAEERVALAQAFDELAQAELAETVLVAPFSGTLLNFVKQQGDTVQAYESVGVLADVVNLQVRAMLPVGVVALVEVGESVEIAPDGQGRTYTGVIDAIDLVVQPLQGQSVQEVTVRFAEGQEIPPIVGAGVDVWLTKTLHEDVIFVPTEAIVTLAGQTYLDVLSDEGVIERTPVVTGVSAAGAVEIVDGVAEGQTAVLP